MLPSQCKLSKASEGATLRILPLAPKQLCIPISGFEACLHSQLGKREDGVLPLDGDNAGQVEKRSRTDVRAPRTGIGGLVAQRQGRRQEHHKGKYRPPRPVRTFETSLALQVLHKLCTLGKVGVSSKSDEVFEGGRMPEIEMLSSTEQDRGDGVLKPMEPRIEVTPNSRIKTPASFGKSRTFPEASSVQSPSPASDSPSPGGP